MKKSVFTAITGLILSVFTATTVMATLIPIETLKGLARTPKADHIEDGEHDMFDNVYIHYGNLQSIKGRDRLNSTAHADTVVNGLFYYESIDHATKKFIVAEASNVVSYAIDGTGRTVIIAGTTNVKWDAVQIGDSLYLTSTNGLYKWTGTGSATLLTGVATPSSIVFTTTTNFGGMTTGLPAVVTNGIVIDTGVWKQVGSLCANGVSYASANTANNVNCPSLSSGFIKTCATSSQYSYKISKWNSTTGIESDSSIATTVSLTGPNTVSAAGRDCFTLYSNNTCTAISGSGCDSAEIVVAGGQTSTSSTLPAIPTTPFDGYCLYRTVASGEDYFKLGCVVGGGVTYKDGKPDNTLGAPLDTTIHTISPPAYKYIEEYKGIIFVAQGNTIKFNHIPTELVTDADKYWLDSDELQVVGNITGMIKASDSLIIFTEKSVYQLLGLGVSSFQLNPIVNGIGAVSKETIKVDTNGDVIFFSGSEGLYKLTIGEQATSSEGKTTVARSATRLEQLSRPNLDNVFSGEDDQIVLDLSTFSTSHAYYDKDNDLYFLYIGQHGFIYDAVNKTWTHIPAIQMTASVWRKSPNSAGTGVLLDNAGFFFNNWTGYDNGIESGTVSGLAGSSSANTLTCMTCTFNTTGDGLKGLWIFIDNENEEYRQITSNSSTLITVSSNWTTPPITTDHFYITPIVTKWRTKQYSFTKYPQESQVSHLYINHNKAASTQEVIVTSFQEKSDVAVNAFSENGTIDFSLHYSDVLNTRMRSTWVQWGFKSIVYNISSTIEPPIDVVGYSIDAEAKDRLAGSH